MVLTGNGEDETGRRVKMRGGRRGLAGKWRTRRWTKLLHWSLEGERGREGGRGREREKGRERKGKVKKEERVRERERNGERGR